MIKRHEMQVLLAAGHSHPRVASETGVSERSVDRIAKEPPVGELDDLGICAARRVGRPSTVSEHEEKVKGWLEEKPDLPTVEVLHRLGIAGYKGGKTAVYELVRALRGPAPSRVMVRFEGLPGEFAQFDFGSVDVTYLLGESEKIRFAAYRLKYSRWVYVEIVPNEQVESLSRSLIRGFEGSGGVPLMVVFDNPKTVVIHPKQTPIVWNPTTAQLAVDFGFAIELCAPRRGEQKGSVENLVGWVKGSFFKVRRFQDRQDMEAQLQEWLTAVNDQRPCRATGEVPAVRLAQELPRLRPLVVAPEDYGLRFDVFVGPTGMVDFKGMHYAMPAETIGFNGTLYLYTDRVRIMAGRHERTHARFPDRNLSYPHELRTEHLARVSGERGRLYFQRQRLLELGPPAEHFLTELIHQRRWVWKGDVEKLFTLLGECGDEPVLRAIQIALMQDLIGAEYVVDIVRKEVSA